MADMKTEEEMLSYGLSLDTGGPALPCRIVLYTDGGCRGNPGPGAWAAVSFLEYMEQSAANAVNICEIAGSAPRTTNNQMELQAVIEGFKALEGHYPGVLAAGRRIANLELAVYTDSQYVKNGISIWIHNWKKNSWRTSAKQPVKNKELWQGLDRQVSILSESCRLQWHWVKGHAGNSYNERCDALVRENFPN